MIRFEYFTRQQAVEWQAIHPKVSGDPLTDMRLVHFEGIDLDQKIGIFAIDGDSVVGTNFFYFCPISIYGRLVECVVSNNLFVHPAYRPKGVGSFLKMYVLKLGYPQISSGVSPSMRKVYDAWSAYTKIDASPVFAIPITMFGLLRVGRLATERASGSAGGRGPLLKAVGARVGRVAPLLGSSGRHRRVLSPAEAERRMEEMLKSESYPIQVPWNRDVVSHAIWGSAARARAWMVEIDSGPSRSAHMITGYLRPMTVRGLGTAQHQIDELHLTEIFPPVRDEKLATTLLGVVVRRARATGASIVHVYAMTEALENACRNLGLDSFYNKRVYIAPNTKDPEMDAMMRTPSNWWCRIRNEDQLEENAFSRAGMLESGDESRLPRMIY